MSNCKKPNFKDFCMDIDTDKLYMTEMPVKFRGKWKEACRKNISGKDRGISLLNKHERSWIKPKDISKKKWNAMSAKKKGKFMKQLWEKEIKNYQICAAQESYKKGRKTLQEVLNKQSTPPPLPPFPTELLPTPPPFPTELLPRSPPSRKTKYKKPKKPAKRKTKKLFQNLNNPVKLSPKTASIWGVLPPRTPRSIPPPRTPRSIPPPRTPNDSPDNWDEYGPDKRTPIKLPKGMREAMQRAVGKGSRKKRKRRPKNSTQKAKRKKHKKEKIKKTRKNPKNLKNK
tara:strand:+ start:17998 stop:18852 length:855 start_codon:yes stop_codon:yes gene_type:complete